MYIYICIHSAHDYLHTFYTFPAVLRIGSAISNFGSSQFVNCGDPIKVEDGLADARGPRGPGGPGMVTMVPWVRSLGPV